MNKEYVTKMPDLPDMQNAAKASGEKMLEFLLQFEPCNVLRVADVKCIADFARMHCFDAIKKVCE